jgi:hypothetical protein
MDMSLMMRGLRVMIEASQALVSPLNSALSPQPATTTTATMPHHVVETQKTAAVTRVGPFKVGLTPDFYTAEGDALYANFGLGTIADTEGAVKHHVMPAGQAEGNILKPEQLKGSHGVLVLACKVTADSLKDGAADDLLVISRFGVGYDSVDIAACTENDVVRCALFDRNSFPRMLLNFTPLLRLKRCHACGK